MSQLDSTDIQALSQILSRHYFAPEVRRRVIPPVTGRRIEKRQVEEPVTEWRTIDDGPAPELLALLVVANLIGLTFIYSLHPVLVVLLLVVATMGGLYAGRSWRKTRVEEVTEIQSVEREVEVEAVVEPERVEEETIGPSRRVLALGKGTIGFRAEATAAGIVVTGPSEAVTPRRLSFSTFDRPERILKVDEPIDEELRAIPWLLEGERASFLVDDRQLTKEKVELCGVERGIREHFDLIAGLFSETRTVPIELSAVTDPLLIAALRPATDDSIVPTDPGIEELETWTSGPEGAPLERFCERWLDRWAKINAALFAARQVSLCDELAPECFDLGQRLGYGSFNFYCPECTKSDQEALLHRDYSVQAEGVCEAIYFSPNARCVYLPATERWRCASCERETAHPIPIHKVLDEFLFPTYDRLMEEHKLERLKAHERTRTGELERHNELETELEKARREQLSAVLALTDEMERFHADVAGEEEAIASMEEILGHFQLEKEATVLAIQARSQEMRQGIERRTREVLDRVDRVKEQEMEVLEEELAELSRAKRIEDERRDAIQREIVRGLDQVEGRIAEGNEINRQGFQRVEGRIAEGNEINRQGFQRVEGRIAEGNEINRQGFQRVEGRIAQGNAIQAAVAKKSGIDLHDEPFWRIDRHLSHWMNDFAATVSGSTTVEREAAKLDSERPRPN